MGWKKKKEGKDKDKEIETKKMSGRGMQEYWGGVMKE